MTNKELSEGMVPWDGGDEAPEDWDGGDVLLRDGSICLGKHVSFWGREEDDEYLKNFDIIAYTPEEDLLG